MASVDNSNPNDPNNPNNVPGNVNQPGQQTNQPATTGGAGGVTATGAGNVTGQVVGTANPSQPFNNISSYLAANAPGGQQLAGQVAGTVAKPIQEAQTGITNAADKFTQSVNAGYTPENKDLTTAVSNNPNFVVKENPENITNFAAQLNDKYTGPTDFAQSEGYGDLQSKIAAANAQAANTGTESGIQQLLGSVEGPTTAGINKLDSLLLSADPGNYKTIQDAGAGAAKLLPTLNQTTTDQNALAASGATNASTAAANALAALGTARGNVSTNLGDEQKTIEGIVNQYNKSVGVINPVVTDISSAIQNFLAANPNIKLENSSDPMAALKNLASIVMPQEASYASPEDYAQIAALAQLGDTNLGGLPISSATSNQAQTFNIPGELQNAIGQAPSVEKALQDELSGFGTQINSAVSPYQDLQNKEMTRAALGNELAKIPKPGFNATPDQKAAYDQATKAIYDKATAAGVPASDLTGNSYWPQLQKMAQSLQWVNGTETSYQQLVDAINGQLGKLGEVGVPTLTYGPNTVTDPVTGTPIGKVAKDVGNAAALGIGAGVPIATGAGLLAGAAPTTASALAGAGSGAVAGEVPAAGLSGLQAAGPAAVAAYGASNIAQNELSNPIAGGLLTAANMGLTLGAMSLPPQIFQSIGKDINNVINSIGDFFGGLF